MNDPLMAEARRLKGACDGLIKEKNALEKENDKLRESLEAVLLFHSGPPWNDVKALRWFNITQDPDCTTKKLCDHIRKVLGLNRNPW